jgi:hypothetical protein
MSAAGESLGGRTQTSRNVLGWEEQIYALAIAIIPIASSPLLQTQIFPMPGAKVPNFILGLAFLAFVQRPGRIARTDRMGRIAFFAFLAYAMFFLVDFIRSIPNIEIFHARFPKYVPSGLDHYVQSDFVVPLLLACLFLYVLRRMCSVEGLTLVMQALSVGAFVLSIVAIGAVVRDPAPLFDADRGPINKLMDSVLGLHYNSVSSLLASAAPVLLYLALKRGSFWSLSYVTALVAVLVVKSRTGLLAFAGVSVATMIVLGKAKQLMAAAPLVVGGALLVLGPTLIQLLAIGVTQKSGVSADQMLSGREESIWLPLLFEWFNDPQKLWLGHGLYSVRTSDVLFTGLLFPAGEAHNVYLEFFLDNGIVLFAIFIAGLVAWLVRTVRLGRRLNNGLFWVLFLCIVSYLIMGFSGHHYFPYDDNGTMFPIVAALINVIRLKRGDVVPAPAKIA